MLRNFLFLGLLVFVFFSCKDRPNSDTLPPIESVTKPWTRWWWLGNAVDEKSIKTTLEAFAKAGLGGVEIANIFGVKVLYLFSSKSLTLISAQKSQSSHNSCRKAFKSCSRSGW